MIPRVLADFHHLSLFNSLQMLFENRLGMDLYRPIGEDWHTEGYWAVYDHPVVVKQFLGLDPAYRPEDGSPPLDEIFGRMKEAGVYAVKDPEYGGLHLAASLDYVKSVAFDYVQGRISTWIPLPAPETLLGASACSVPLRTTRATWPRWDRLRTSPSVTS